MSVTPGKFGEVFKSYLLKKIDDIPIPVSAPIVFAERITDFYSVLLLAFIGSLVMGQGMTVIILTALFFILATLLLNNRKMSLAIIKYFERFNFLEKYISKIEESYESSYTMLRIKPLYEMTLLSLLAWLPECLGFYLILDYFSVDVSVLWSVFVYTFSIIVGALTMLPAGIGVTEGSLSYFIFDVTKNMDLAVTVTFLIRISTLWYAVIIGIISLAIIKKKRNIENL